MQICACSRAKTRRKWWSSWRKSIWNIISEVCHRMSPNKTRPLRGSGWNSKNNID
jgi:hypothetical protein